MTYNEKIILIMRPVMLELEKMGINPIKNMSGKQTMDKIENRYIAIRSADKKYPDWAKVVNSFIGKVMRSWPKELLNLNDK